MIKKILFIFTLLGSSIVASAQKVLTLEECLQQGIERNLGLQGKWNEVRKASFAVSENRALLLPQINAFANFNDNFDPPVSVTDGSSYGVPYNVTHTLPFSSTVGLQLNMPLYNQTLYTSLALTKLVKEMSHLSYGKAREELILQICKMYYLGQVTAEQLSLIKENIVRIQELQHITQAFYDNQMALEVDLKRVTINLENLQAQYDNAQSVLEQQLNTLKYVIDYPFNQEIALTPIEADEIQTTKLSGLSEGLWEFQMLNQQGAIAEKQKSLIAQGYLPSLNLTGNWMYSAWTDEFKNWFHAGESNKWYRSYGIGLSLRIPVYDSFNRKYKIRKANVDIENVRLNTENTRKALTTQYLNATNDLMNNRRNYQKQKANFQLAEEVCTVTTDRYREGIASMTEVLQDEMRVSEAQNNYVSASFNYRLANLTLLRLTGKLEENFKIR